MSAVDIRILQPEDIREVARIHCDSLAEDFLPFLGAGFLERGYYRAALANPHGAVFVARSNGAIAGFVNVTHRPDAYFGWTVKHSILQVAVASLRLLRQPARLAEALAIVAAPAPSFGHPFGEISFIAVDRRYRGAGVGHALVRAASRHLAQRGLRAAATKTLRRNAGVIALYRTFGAEIRATVSIRKKDYVYLEWPLPLRESENE